ncbi:MAG: hypothetical protein QF436_02865 [Candidatus Woesearchaeota archaeon]|jgi:hypothetical protein|nr:hypothetical protein [Candidatus Woesearchaeota archaeon]MDP7623032.1 hypothetical protein [Candidatus Woesearchaeota archaeon]HJN56614.1 hypothetical protein [Candidatus Woesearchaeota archaeon]|tara:strand:- start:21959 stop:22438 length:480 start_codon:yes stop_codon:yes gene_type:complete
MKSDAYVDKSGKDKILVDIVGKRDIKNEIHRQYGDLVHECKIKGMPRYEDREISYSDKILHRKINGTIDFIFNDGKVRISKEDFGSREFHGDMNKLTHKVRYLVEPYDEKNINGYIRVKTTDNDEKITLKVFDMLRGDKSKLPAEVNEIIDRINSIKVE